MKTHESSARSAERTGRAGVLATGQPGAGTRVGAAALAGVALLGASACSVSDDVKTGTSSSQAAGADKTVTLVTHESWSPDKKVMASFTKETGYTVKVVKSGDAGELANKVVLSKNNPLGDVVFGIDNTFASRVAKGGVLEPYTSKAASASTSMYDLPEGQGKGALSPIDTAAVCVNVDDAWFAARGKAKPRTLDDLTKPAYKNLMVAPGASSSSPGMAFLLATIGSHGADGWKPYWNKLMNNGLKLTSGWSDAYGVDFSGGEGRGTRPIVVSYDSSPAFTVDKKTGRSTTSALLDTCFRSTEYAGVLKGAKNPEGAKALVDFLSGQDFQATLPGSMYVFPVDSSVELPSDWAKFVTPAKKTIEVSPAEIDKNRSAWLTQWKDVTSK